MDFNLASIHDWWYRLKCKLWHKYNRVTVKTLPPTWVDRDELLAHSMFQILKDYVEKEDGLAQWEHEPEVGQKMQELLDWWTNTYLTADTNDELERKPNESLTECMRRRLSYAKSLEATLNEKLIEIINIRRRLWS